MKIQNYNELKFTNDFMFAKVMRNRKLCKQLLEVILDVEIEHIEDPEEQKNIQISMDARSVRLDVYVKDSVNTVYNVEMQTSNPKNLPKRSRYYQGMIDLNLIEKGEDYNKLNKSYVIFICTEDIFKKGRHIYTFENLCIQDTEIHLKDETTKVFLNPISDMDDVDEELKNFLLYVAEGIPVDDFTRELEQEIELVKNNKEWEAEYMTLKMIERERYAEGRAEGVLTTLTELVQKGLLTVKDAAAQADMTVEEFQRETGNL